MGTLSYEQQKSLLQTYSYCLTYPHGKVYGKCIGFDQDHRGFGGVVVYRNGTRKFFGVNHQTMSVYDMGTPPNPRR
jgi:hypothetical protein